ncbi:MAG: shikimate kinase [Chitinophagaceae bacterium]|nr:shikimate kinase [Chitinophagaceae bacterium]
MKIFLLGFMGTGKTYWGRLWAREHQMDFFDLDTVIEATTGLTIPAIFEQHGEQYFREKERELLHSFAGKHNFILSTGGGTPCFFNNMEWMNEQGVTVYLQTPVSILKKRLISEKGHRPLIKDLNDDEIETFIEKRLEERSRFYSSARLIFSTESITDTTFTEIKRFYV